MKKMNYGKGIEGYLRTGDLIVRHKDGYVVSMYRRDKPTIMFRPRGKLTVKALQNRNSRGSLAKIMVLPISIRPAKLGTASVRESRGTREKILIRKKG